MFYEMAFSFVLRWVGTKAWAVCKWASSCWCEGVPAVGGFAWTLVGVYGVGAYNRCVMLGGYDNHTYLIKFCASSPSPPTHVQMF